MEYIFIVILYVLSWIIHLTWAIWATLIIKKIFYVRNTVVAYVITFVTWAIIVILCRGCPFTYLHQYLEIKAGWSTGITYHFEESLLYQIFHFIFS